MNRREVAAVIAFAGRLDPRLIRTDEAEARSQLDSWHELLGDVPATTSQGWDVRDAVRKRVVASQYPILPADVAREWNAHYRDRLGRHTDPTPMADPDDPQAWRAELVATRDAVVTGRIAPSPHRGVTTGEPRPGLERILKAVGTYVPDAVRAELAPFRPARAAREAAIAAAWARHLQRPVRDVPRPAGRALPRAERWRCPQPEHQTARRAAPGPRRGRPGRSRPGPACLTRPSPLHRNVLPCGTARRRTPSPPRHARRTPPPPVPSEPRRPRRPPETALRHITTNDSPAPTIRGIADLAGRPGDCATTCRPRSSTRCSSTRLAPARPSTRPSRSAASVP